MAAALSKISCWASYILFLYFVYHPAEAAVKRYQFDIQENGGTVMLKILKHKGTSWDCRQMPLMRIPLMGSQGHSSHVLRNVSKFLDLIPVFTINIDQLLKLSPIFFNDLK
ncbi:hypothetical protein OIU79_014314 [Salix purpurea]|uniref:Uncharacterized protein n=1 Tax=Salix purpurea TaxID=77065 RepID=A0A9Q0SWZ7_SALPP|nr:hypothetical protein OIU79_014314 [Salix purpurea]